MISEHFVFSRSKQKICSNLSLCLCCCTCFHIYGIFLKLNFHVHGVTESNIHKSNLIAKPPSFTYSFPSLADLISSRDIIIIDEYAETHLCWPFLFPICWLRLSISGFSIKSLSSLLQEYRVPWFFHSRLPHAWWAPQPGHGIILNLVSISNYFCTYYYQVYNIFHSYQKFIRLLYLYL